MKKISIIIFTRNRKQILEQALNKYKEQTYQNFEIIVLDNNSTDATGEMVKSKFPEVNYTYFPDNLFLYAFNYGVSIATGDYIWRTDDDAYPQTNTLFQEIIEKFNTYPELDILATEIFEVEQNYHSKWYTAQVKHSSNKNRDKNSGFNVYSFIGVGAMIKKAVFNEIGGFRDFGFEEPEFSTRAIIKGKTIRVFPDLVVLHFATASTRNWGERRIEYYSMLTKYFTKYFPLHTILINLVLILFVFNLYFIIQRYSISIFFEGNLSILSQFFKSYRTEHTPLSPPEIEKITFGQSYVNREYTFFYNRIKNKLKRRNNNNKK